MVEATPFVACPFLSRLMALLATEMPSSPFLTPDITFRLLCELEDEAKRFGASESSRHAISRVRQWVGDSLALSKSRSAHRLADQPMVYRTVYHCQGVTVGWTTSSSSLLGTIQAAKEEMVRHGADTAHVVEDDGLGAVVWSSVRQMDKA